MNEENRTKKWRERGRREGKKQVNVMLDPEGAEALENLQEALPGWSYARIISRALALAEEDPARLDTRVDHKVKGSIDRLEEEMEEVLKRLKALELQFPAAGRPKPQAMDPVADTWNGTDLGTLDDATVEDMSGPGVAKPYVVPGDSYDRLPEDVDNLEEDDLGLFASSDDLPEKP